VVIDPPGDAVGVTVLDADGVRLEKLHVTGATDGIAFVNAFNGVILKCRVADVTGRGINLTGGGNILIEKCAIQDTGDDGISVGDPDPASNCTISISKVLRAGGQGIRINGNFNVVDRTLILQPAGIGLSTNDVPVATGNSVTAVKVVKAGGEGFEIAGEDNELVDCKVIQAGEDGAELFSGENTLLTNCTFVKPALDGIFAEATSHALSIIGCKFSKPGGNGIDVDGDDAVVQDNKCSGAGDNGYAVLGDGGTWTNNSATGSKDDGFEIAGMNNTLTQNKAKGSKNGFDLNDLAGKGANSIDETNSFKTKGP
jgi:hypothetical protein